MGKCFVQKEWNNMKIKLFTCLWKRLFGDRMFYILRYFWGKWILDSTPHPLPHHTLYYASYATPQQHIHFILIHHTEEAYCFKNILRFVLLFGSDVFSKCRYMTCWNNFFLVIHLREKIVLLLLFGFRKGSQGQMDLFIWNIMFI